MAQGVGHAGPVGAGRRRRCPRVAAQRSRAGQDVLSGHRVLLRQATRHPVAGCLWRGGPRPAEKSQRGEWVASVNVVLPRTLSHRHGISTKDLTHEPAIRERCALPCPALPCPALPCPALPKSDPSLPSAARATWDHGRIECNERRFGRLAPRGERFWRGPLVRRQDRIAAEGWMGPWRGRIARVYPQNWWVSLWPNLSSFR